MHRHINISLHAPSIKVDYSWQWGAGYFYHYMLHLQFYFYFSNDTIFEFFTAKRLLIGQYQFVKCMYNIPSVRFAELLPATGWHNFVEY